MNIDTLDKKASVFNHVITSLAILAAGIWAFYTYFLSDEAIHLSKLREFRFTETPTIEMKTEVLESDGSSLIKIDITIKNNSDKVISLEAYQGYSDIVFVSKAYIEDTTYRLGEPIYAYEGYLPTHIDVTMKQAPVLIPPTTSGSINYITPKLSPGVYQVNLLANLKSNKEIVKRFYIDRREYIAIKTMEE